MHLFGKENDMTCWLKKMKCNFYVATFCCRCCHCCLWLKVGIAVVLSTEALFVFGALVAIYHGVTIHLSFVRLLRMGILMVGATKK